MVFIMFRLNISGFARCGENFMIALEHREFIYEFNFEINEPSSHLNLIDFSIEEWSDINKLKEWQAETSRHAIPKIKDFINENNVSFVGLITLILTVIGCLLFLCYYCKCYTFVYSKLIKFYLRTHSFKNTRKLKNAGVFKNTQVPVEPTTSVVPSRSPNSVEQELNERHESRSSRNRPSPVLRPKTTTQDATSDRITFDF